MSKQSNGLQAVYNAWNMHGPQPQFHYVKVAALYRDWPTLADALEEMTRTTPKGEPPTLREPDQNRSKDQLYRINEGDELFYTVRAAIDRGHLIPVESDAGIELCLECKSEANGLCFSQPDTHTLRGALAYVMKEER